MWGQWIGKIKGTNTGQVILNIDRDSPNFGTFCVSDYEPNNPYFNAKVYLNKNGNEVIGDMTSFNLFSYETNLKKRQLLQNNLPKIGKLEGKIDKNNIYGNWNTDIDTKGEFELFKADDDFESTSNFEMTWEEFKILGIR